MRDRIERLRAELDASPAPTEPAAATEPEAPTETEPPTDPHVDHGG